VAIYTSAKALSRWPINDESTLTNPNFQFAEKIEQTQTTKRPAIP
jgi:hypothetical protein